MARTTFDGAGFRLDDGNLTVPPSELAGGGRLIDWDRTDDLARPAGFSPLAFQLAVRLRKLMLTCDRTHVRVVSPHPLDRPSVLDRGDPATCAFPRGLACNWA